MVMPASNFSLKVVSVGSNRGVLTRRTLPLDPPLDLNHKADSLHDEVQQDTLRALYIVISVLIYCSTYSKFFIVWNHSGRNYASFTRKKKNPRCLISVVQVLPNPQLIMLKKSFGESADYFNTLLFGFLLFNFQ